MRSPDFSVGDENPVAALRKPSDSTGEFGSCAAGLDSVSGWFSALFNPKPSRHWAQNPPGLSAGMAVPHSLHVLPELMAVPYKQNGAQTLQRRLNFPLPR